MMSHHNLAHRESVLTSSPLRRKSMLNITVNDTSLPQNDDDAERMERRRNAEMEMRQRDITPPASEKRKSIGGIAGLSATQLAEHYANCIKLSAENKINAKNAFSLQLIDYMAMMLKKRDSKMDNFQVASCTLDASTKIYAYRVDCVHTDVLKMAGGLAAGHRKKNTEAEGEEGGEDGELNDDFDPEEMATVKKKKSKKKSTIAANVETLNAKADLQHAMDPFFLRSAGNMSDCQPGDCHFLTRLKILNNCALMLCSDMPYWDVNDNLPSIESVDVPLPPVRDLSDKAICPVFSQFSFTTWSLDNEEECESLIPQPVLPDADDDFAFDVNAVPEPVPESEAPVDHFEVSGIDEGLDSDAEEPAAPVACVATQKTPAAKIIDMRKHLSVAPSEYSYFRAGALDLWAGPSHWKIRPVRNTGGVASETGEDGSEANVAKKQKQKQKKELVVDFGLDENIRLSASETTIVALKLTKRTMQKVWSGERNTHPPDIHFDIKRFSQLELRKLIGVSLDPVPVEDDQPSGYDYENDHDTSEYCPNLALGDDIDDADDAAGDDGFLGTQTQDVHHNFTMEGTTQMEGFIGDNLVAPPNKVARIFVPYAMRAKKVDMKKLKTAIWDILTDADSRKDAENRETWKVEKSVSFRDMYNTLPLRLSSKQAENLSAPLAIVALLHLANEKTLHIEGTEDLADLKICQG